MRRKMSSSNFFDVIVLILSSFDSNPSFLSILLLVLELSQLLFISNLIRHPEIEKTFVLPNAEGPGQIRETRLDMGVPNEK